MSKIGEDRQIALKQQLLQFRESDQTDMAFPASLTNLERKFIHRTATELGLISSSSGVEAQRFIAVQKKNAGVSSDKRGPIVWSLSSKASQALSSADVALAMRELKQVVREEEDQDTSASRHVLHRHGFKKLHDVRHTLAATHRIAEAKRRERPEYDAIHEKRHMLPAAHHKLAVCKMVHDHQIVLVSGETGCGKSTQVPQFLLDSESHGPTSRIVVTQPRRISAMSLAERIAYERCEEVGEQIGYNIRLEHKLSDKTQLVYVTPGVLLRKLLIDPDLEEFSHVVIDEAHERDRFTEFLLILLRDLCARRHSMRLVLMSATMHTDKLRSYFGDIPQINVGGSVFPVQEFFLEHVLKFTDYLTPHQQAAGTSKSRALSAPTLRTRYQCSACGGGPFASPEELGTHAAFCFGLKEHNHSAHTLQRHSSDEVRARVEYVKRSIKPQPGFEVADGVDRSDHKASAVNFASQIEEIEIDVEDDTSDVSYDGWVEDEDAPYDDLTDPSAAESEKQLLSEESAEFAGLLEAYQKHCVQSDEKSVDHDLIVALLRFALHSEFGREGAVLVFLPGWDDISSLHRLLTSLPDFCDPKKHSVLQLHSGIPKKDQQLVFQPAPPGCRKIVLSTNIAETSLTIDDVSVVIDSGLAKEKTYDPHTKLSFLKVSYISQAAARQRKGRAGRTRSGVCFRLYSLLRSRHLSEFQDSELLRMPLEELVLQAKSLGVAPGAGDALDSAKGFLQKAMDPPSTLSIQHGLDLLQALQALDGDEQLTRLGEMLAHLPMNPRLGKMMLQGCVLGCGPAIVNMGAIMSFRDPFLMPTNEAQMQRSTQNKITFAQNSFADPMAVLHVLEAFSTHWARYSLTEARQYCEQRDLSFGVMQQLKALMSELDYNLQDVGINCRLARSQAHNGHVPLVTALLSTGIYPNLAVRRKGAKLFTTEKGSKAKIHASSINSKMALYKSECRASAQLICYQELTEISPHSQAYNIGGANYMMRSTAPMSILTFLLTCGELQEVPASSVEGADPLVLDDSVFVTADHWLTLQLRSHDLVLVKAWRDFLGLSVLAFVDQLTSSRVATQGQAKQGVVSVLGAPAVSRAVDKLVQALEAEHHVSTDSSAK